MGMIRDLSGPMLAKGAGYSPMPAPGFMASRCAPSVGKCMVGQMSMSRQSEMARGSVFHGEPVRGSVGLAGRSRPGLPAARSLIPAETSVARPASRSAGSDSGWLNLELSLLQ